MADPRDAAVRTAAAASAICRRTYALVIVVEVVVIAALYWLGRALRLSHALARLGRRRRLPHLDRRRAACARAAARTEMDGYFRANRSLPWWAVGLSVMATQLSAITLVGTTGQGYADGMRFVQFYFGLPIAMVILSITLVPFFYRSGVYTAYEYLERRFD